MLSSLRWRRVIDIRATEHPRGAFTSEGTSIPRQRCQGFLGHAERLQRPRELEVVYGLGGRTTMAASMNGITSMAPLKFTMQKGGMSANSILFPGNNSSREML